MSWAKGVTDPATDAPTHINNVRLSRFSNNGIDGTCRLTGGCSNTPIRVDLGSWPCFDQAVDVVSWARVDTQSTLRATAVIHDGKVVTQ